MRADAATLRGPLGREQAAVVVAIDGTDVRRAPGARPGGLSVGGLRRAA
jgi:hypothetical protein